MVKHFGLDADAAEIQRTIAESGFYSKAPARRAFAGVDPARRPITDAIRAAAWRFAEPGYRALASRD